MWNEVDSTRQKRDAKGNPNPQKKVLRAALKQVGRSTAWWICREKKVNTIRTANKNPLSLKRGNTITITKTKTNAKKQALERWIVSRWEKGGTVASREKERQIEAFSRTVALTWRRRWRRSKTFESVCHKPEIVYYKRKIPSEIKLASPKRHFRVRAVVMGRIISHMLRILEHLWF